MQAETEAEDAKDETEDNLAKQEKELGNLDKAKDKTEKSSACSGFGGTTGRAWTRVVLRRNPCEVQRSIHLLKCCQEASTE